MENLNKNQIVLLTLLVSFVTSIATGIVTVTLMDQAPAGVTQTINRVVERTIEKVVPGEPVIKTVVKEVPVIVTEEDLIVKVINEASPAVVRINDNGVSLGSGFITSDDGLIVTAAHLLTRPSVGQFYKISFRSGDETKARLIKFSLDNDIALMQIDSAELSQLKTKLLAAVTAASSTANQVSWTPLLLQTSDITPGQTVIALGSPDNGPLNVSVGIVSSVDQASTSTAHLIRTNAANVYNSGGPILNTKGKVVGLSKEAGSAINVSALAAFISSVQP